MLWEHGVVSSNLTIPTLFFDVKAIYKILLVVFFSNYVEKVGDNVDVANVVKETASNILDKTNNLLNNIPGNIASASLGSVPKHNETLSFFFNLRLPFSILGARYLEDIVPYPGFACFRKIAQNYVRRYVLHWFKYDLLYLPPQRPRVGSTGVASNPNAFINKLPYTVSKRKSKGRRMFKQIIKKIPLINKTACANCEDAPDIADTILDLIYPILERTGLVSDYILLTRHDEPNSLTRYSKFNEYQKKISVFWENRMAEMIYARYVTPYVGICIYVAFGTSFMVKNLEDPLNKIIYSIFNDNIAHAGKKLWTGFSGANFSAVWGKLRKEINEIFALRHFDYSSKKKVVNSTLESYAVCNGCYRVQVMVGIPFNLSGKKGFDFKEYKLKHSRKVLSFLAGITIDTYSEVILDEKNSDIKDEEILRQKNRYMVRPCIGFSWYVTFFHGWLTLQTESCVDPTHCVRKKNDWIIEDGNNLKFDYRLPELSNVFVRLALEIFINWSTKMGIDISAFIFGYNDKETLEEKLLDDYNRFDNPKHIVEEHHIYTMY